MAYRVEIHGTAQKQLLTLPKETQGRIVLAIDGLTITPRPNGCKKLRETGLWRIRTGRYRIIYAIEDETHLIRVVKVATRRENTYK